MRARHNEPLDDSEYPDEFDISGDNDSIDIKLCQNCGSEIFEDADQCPHCGYWQQTQRSSWRNSSKFYVRVGAWATKTIALNWIFWIFISAVATVAIWMRWIRN